MEVTNIKKALRHNRMESDKSQTIFTDISKFDVVPTPPKDPKPAEALHLRRKHRIRIQHFETHEAKYGHSLDSETHIYRLEPSTVRDSKKVPQTNDPAVPWYCPTPLKGNRMFGKEEKTMKQQALYDDVFPYRGEKPTTKCGNETVNPIRYPVPGPKQQLVPSLFPVNKNRLPPVVDPKKKTIPESPHVGPRPIKAKHVPIYQENTEASCMLTQMYGCRDDFEADRVIPAKSNNRPIRYLPPGPRKQLLPNPFPVNKSSLPPLITHRGTVPPMRG